MSNYSVTGNLKQAADSLSRARGALSYTEQDKALREAIDRAQVSVERLEKRAKKMIPGGFKADTNYEPRPSPPSRYRYGPATDQSHRGDGAEAVAP